VRKIQITIAGFEGGGRGHKSRNPEAGKVKGMDSPELQT
jgi:hypothetical protein